MHAVRTWFCFCWLANPRFTGNALYWVTTEKDLSVHVTNCCWFSNLLIRRIWNEICNLDSSHWCSRVRSRGWGSPSATRLHLGQLLLERFPYWHVIYLCSKVNKSSFHKHLQVLSSKPHKIITLHFIFLIKCLEMLYQWREKAFTMERERFVLCLDN